MQKNLQMSVTTSPLDPLRALLLPHRILPASLSVMVFPAAALRIRKSPSWASFIVERVAEALAEDKCTKELSRLSIEIVEEEMVTESDP